MTTDYTTTTTTTTDAPTIAERVATLEPYRAALESRETLRRSAEGNRWHYLGDAGDMTALCGYSVQSGDYSVPFADIASDVHDCDRCREVLEGFTPAPVRCTFPNYSGSFAIGTGAGDPTIGRDAINAYRHALPYPWATVTVVDVLAAWSARFTAYDADLSMVGRTLRAAARSHGWSHHYDDAMSSLDVVHPVMRGTFDAPTTIPASPDADTDGPTSSERYRAMFPMSLPFASGVTMSQLLDAASIVIRRHTVELEDIAQAFHDKAVECGWCGEYERTVERLNDELSSVAGSPFMERDLDRDWNVSGTITVTVSIPWSTSVTATDEDSASDYGYDSLRDTFDIADALSNEGVSWDQARALARSWSFDVDSVEVDEVCED